MKYFYWVLCLLLAGCQPESPPLETYSAEDFKSEIDELKSPSQRGIYLEKILRTDQKIKKEETKIIQTTGYNSKEHKTIRQKSLQTDNINFPKVEQYLKTHGYPIANREGIEAAATPLYIIHHNNDIAYRNNLFPILYQAFLRNDIQDREMALYLNRSHELKFGNVLTIPNPFTRAAQIDSLIKRLELSTLSN